MVVLWRPVERRVRTWLRWRRLFAVVGLVGAVLGAGALAGPAGSVAVRLAGPISWGNDSSGQLGDGKVGGNSPSPGPINLAGTVRLYSAGNQSSYAQTSDGNVWAWGDNSQDELGPAGGRRKRSPTPVAMQGLCTSCGGVVQLASGENNAFVLFADGKVQAWGDNAHGALGVGPHGGGPNPSYVLLPGPAIAISAGARHGVALEADGTVWTWGQNNDGQLGNGTTTDSAVPIEVAGISGAIAVSAADLYTMALLPGGSVWSWGYNAWGQLGDGTTMNRYSPVAVVGLPQPVMAISAGGNLQSNGHALALMQNGTVMAWGRNTSGELGNGSQTDSSVPVSVSTIANVTQLAAGGTYSVAVVGDGEVYTWGGDAVGQLGTGNPLDSSDVPILVPNLSGVTILSAGPPGHVLAYIPFVGLAVRRTLPVQAGLARRGYRLWYSGGRARKAPKASRARLEAA